MTKYQVSGLTAEEEATLQVTVKKLLRGVRWEDLDLLDRQLLQKTGVFPVGSQPQKIPDDAYDEALDRTFERTLHIATHIEQLR